MSEIRQRIEHSETQEQGREFVNVGEPPITGLKKKGRSERKERCEDVKMNDPEKGLFLVADGVSEANGWFASQEAAAVADEILGEALDRQLENILGSDQAPDDRKITLMDQLIRTEMKRTVLEADQNIKTKSGIDPRLTGKTATTFSLARHVEMPDKTQHAYVANIGDSRVFVLRQGKLFRLTEDDNLLSYALAHGRVTKAEAALVDQADGAEALPEHLKEYFRQRRMISRAVGDLSDETVDVKRYRVLPGDRLVLASDGLTDQFKEKQIQIALNEVVDDRQAERSLQTLADEMALDGTHPRAKGDDISVVVRTIGEHGPDRSYLHQGEARVEPEILPEHVQAWRTLIPKTQRALQEARQHSDEQEIHRREKELAQLEYWVARMDLQAIQKNTPARFEQGDDVSVGNDVKPWMVRDYSAERDHYIVSHPSAHKHQIIDRFDLELSQKGDLARPGDKIDMKTPEGSSHGVYTVVGEDHRGFVVLIREVPEGIERRLEHTAVVEEAMRAQLQQGRMLKKQMQRTENYLLDKKS